MSENIDLTPRRFELLRLDQIDHETTEKRFRNGAAALLLLARDGFLSGRLLPHWNAGRRLASGVRRNDSRVLGL